MKTSVLIVYALFTFIASSSLSITTLDFSSPEETFKTFYSAMSDYSKGLKTQNETLQLRIHDAFEALEPSIRKNPTYSNSKLTDKVTLLKEIIDRLVDHDNPQIKNNRLAKTNIFFTEVNGWHYISEYSLDRAEIDYATVSKEPYLNDIPFPGAGHKKTWIEKNFPRGNLVKFLGISQSQWILIFLALIAAVLIYYLLIWSFAFIEGLSSKSEKLSFDIAKALTQPVAIFAAALFLQNIENEIVLNGNAKLVWSAFIKVLFSIGSFWVLYCLVTPVEKALKRLTEKTQSELDDHLVPLISKTSRVIIVILATLTVIQGLGVNVFSLLAGLGVGGLAIALAAKDTAANFFGSLMILFDQPFKIGDWVKIDTLEGTVEEIGFRSTRIRTFYDSQIVMPNSKVANCDIDNLGRRQYRRTVETLGVTYSTTEKQLQSFVEGVKDIINTHPLTRKDKHYISFKKFGDSSLEVLLYFFLSVSDYKDELMAKEEILFKIKALAESLKVSFAFPSQSLYIEQVPDSLEKINSHEK